MNEGVEDKRPSDNADQKLPKGHFDRDGMSNGKQTGPVRKSWDAQQGPRERQPESKSRDGTK